MDYVVATNKIWNKDLFYRKSKDFSGNWHIISSPEKLTINRLKEIKPRYVFFPHWSYIIPVEIYTQFECIIFHMTDVPYGRGGSPLQNLISRGIYETNLTALRCVKALDAGPVYTKKKLSLYGSAEEIYIRAGKITWELIRWIVENNPIPIEQKDEPVNFLRRKPEDGDVSKLETLQQFFDFIRMLDADGYPPSFLEVGKFKLEFSRASFKQGYVCADVKICMKDNS